MSLDELLIASRSGEPEDRRALALALYASLRAFFRRDCLPGDAEDLVQATLEVLFRGMDRFEPEHPRAFEALVFTTAGRVLFTKRRSWSRERARRVDSPPAAIALDTSASGRLAHRETVDRVFAAIRELDSTDQRTLQALFADVGWREQAEIEGIARATVRSRVRRALRRVREVLRRTDAMRPNPEPSTT